MKIRLSKSQWEQIGRKAKWIPADPSTYSDADLPPASSPQEEEDAIFGKDENDPNHAYNSGFEQGEASRKYKHISDLDNPYRIDTEEGKRKYDEWRAGFNDNLSSVPHKYKHPQDYAKYQAFVEEKRKKNFRPDWMEGQPEGFTGIKSIRTIKNIRKAQNLDVVKTPDKFTERELTRAIRDAIMAEEGAIKQYETVVDASDDEKVKKTLQSIADEEKVHVGELQKLLSMLLKDEQGFLDDGAKEVE